jgi:CubicO group peptidase (beta-lactamase class C family)
MRRRSAAIGSLAVLVATVLSVGSPALAQTSNVQDRKCEEGKRAKGEGDVCTSGSKQATEMLETVRRLKADNPIVGLVFGVWKGGEQVVTGALGEALPGVPATRDVHFRMGNVGEMMSVTRLLQLVDEGKVSLDDKLSEYFPDFPNADEVTLDMLARSITGYQDFVTVPAFYETFEADPFRQWTLDELLAFAADSPPVFSPPGSSWAFSDTNFILLGNVVEQIDGPINDQYEKSIYEQLEMTDTRSTTTAEIEPPVLHAYSAERGKNEDVTFWSISWEPVAGDVSSNLADMGKLGEAVGKGTLVSKKSHELQVGTQNVGLGPLTKKMYYGMGTIVANGWIGTNPQVDGYTATVFYLPEEDTTIVVNATFGPTAPVGTHYAAMVFNALAEIVSPDHAPNLSVRPRGASSN